MKILTILGARPQFVKAGAVSRAIRSVIVNSDSDRGEVAVGSDSDSGVVTERSDSGEKEDILSLKTITEIIVHTGQHYDKNMSDVFFKELHLPKPDYFLGIGGKSHGAMTGEMILKLEEVMLKEKPDVVLVYGDTNSTLAGAIAASKLHIPIAHVEAGLRSFNMKMPEEINRILVAMYYKQFAKKPLSLSTVTNNFILCTIHRAENTDNPQRLKNIFEALEVIAKNTQIILPLHPRTKQKLKSLSLSLNTVTIIEPVGYLEMIWLLNNCHLVMTDSGGLQKEAYFFKKPCITLRDETEWVELVDVDANVLVGADKEKIVTVASDSKRYFSKFYSQLSLSIDTNLYGNGNASEKILKELLK